MLLSLRIQNFALIDDITLEFDPRLNILTGETGAGKSIVIDALRSALGAKISASQLREPSLACKIEAQFDLSRSEIKTSEIFQDYLQDNDGTLIISRIYSPDGKNTIRVNGSAVTVSQLKDIGRMLMDFHGAHDHQMLLSEDSHIKMLDRLADINNLLSEYSRTYTQYRSLVRQLDELKQLAQSRERETDLLSHQLKELESIRFSEEAYQQIKSDRAKVQNSEKLFEYIRQISELLEGGQPSFSENIRRTFTPMRKLNEIDEQTAKLGGWLTQVQETHTNLLEELSSYASSLSFDAKEAEDIYAKCDAYESALKKYGPALADAEQFYHSAKTKYDNLIHLEENNEKIQSEIRECEKELSAVARKISKKRKATADQLKTIIEKELTELGIKNVKFDVRFEKVDFTSNGFDRVIFYISPNAGQELRPLADIVSSGEAARVMLALKKALVDVDPIPTLIFDEIDAQIGGRLGTITGQKLRDIASRRQVVLITHLPQIASFADKHFKITKGIKNGKAVTKVDDLDREARVDEMAEMMAGEDKNKTALAHAEEMLATASSGKLKKR